MSTPADADELKTVKESYYKFLQYVSIREGNLSVREDAKYKLRLMEIELGYANRTELPPPRHHQ